VEAGTELTASYLGIEDGLNREVRRNFLKTHFRYVKSKYFLKTHFRYIKASIRCVLNKRKTL
jgi:hypothetical protein